MVTPRFFISFTHSNPKVSTVGFVFSLLCPKIIACVLSLFILSPDRFPKSSITFVTPLMLSSVFSILRVMSSAKPSRYLLTVAILSRLSWYVILKGLTVSDVLILTSRISIHRMNSRLAIGSPSLLLVRQC